MPHAGKAALEDGGSPVKQAGRQVASDEQDRLKPDPLSSFSPDSKHQLKILQEQGMFIFMQVPTLLKELI